MRPLRFALATASFAVAAAARPAWAQGSAMSVPDTSGHSLAAAGRTKGDTAAAGHTQFGWFARGAAAGVVAGPLGMWWIVHRAGHSTVQPAEPERTMMDSRGPDFALGYRVGYEQRTHSERQEYAFMGGALGTAAFTFALLRATHLVERTGGTPENPPPPTFVVSIPF